MIKLSICLSDLPKEKFTTSEKNGKKYIDLILWENRDGVDKFGNSHSITVSKTKEEKDQPNKYVGNGKDLLKKVVNVSSSSEPLPLDAKPNANDTDDLPF